MFATDEAEHLLQSGMRLSSMKHDADSLWSWRWLIRRHDNIFSRYNIPFIQLSYSGFGLCATVVFSQLGVFHVKQVSHVCSIFLFILLCIFIRIVSLMSAHAIEHAKASLIGDISWK
jgi:hypothetical protein